MSAPVPLPSEGFFNLLDAVLRIEGQAHIAHLFAGAECSLEGSASLLPGAHGYFQASIIMAVPIDRVRLFTDEIQREIRRAANQIMPPSAGYRVTEIQLSPVPAPAPGQQVADLIAKVNRLRSSRAQIEVRVGTARELLEATCMVILRERNPSLQVGCGWGLLRLLGEAEKVLTLVPTELSPASQDATKKVLEKLSSLSQNLDVAELDTKQAGIAVWAATTLTMYLIDSHKPRYGKPEALGGLK